MILPRSWACRGAAQALRGVAHAPRHALAGRRRDDDALLGQWHVDDATRARPARGSKRRGAASASTCISSIRSGQTNGLPTSVSFARDALVNRRRERDEPTAVLLGVRSMG